MSELITDKNKNVNIIDSVGLGGRNIKKDVEKIQVLLNRNLRNPYRPLIENGRCDGKTINAIKRFQRQVVKLKFPDGKVDKQGKTMAALSNVALKKIPDVLVPYKGGSGEGFYIYGDSDKLYGTPRTVASILKLASRVNVELGIEIGIGELSNKSGITKGHQSHQRGVDIDIRPIRKDRARKPVTIESLEYDHETTKKMITILKEDKNLLLILFNDVKINGVINSSGHDNHLHIRFNN